MTVMMTMIMIAGFVDSITTPIKSWIETLVNSDDDHHKMMVKKLGVDDGSPVDCIVCLSEVPLGEKYAMLERCKHGFHVECVEAWLKHHPNCPLCRTPVSEHTFYLNKLYQMMSCYGLCALDIMATWLTKSFSQGLQSSLSQSCTYL